MENEENLQENLDAIEAEKKEFLETGNFPEDNTEEQEEEKEVDVEVIEFSLSDEEIDELIDKLKEIKENKGHFHFEIDDENELFIHHEEDELGE